MFKRCQFLKKTSFVGTAGRKWRVKMGSKTKIDWCDSTWNPVTGCLHDCAYCYARKIAERFGGVNYEDELENRYGEYDVVCLHAEEDVHKLDRPIVDFYSGKKAPYPWEFDPTFHRYKLDEPQKWKKPFSAARKVLIVDGA